MDIGTKNAAVSENEDTIIEITLTNEHDNDEYLPQQVRDILDDDCCCNSFIVRIVYLYIINARQTLRSLYFVSLPSMKKIYCDN